MALFRLISSGRRRATLRAGRGSITITHRTGGFRPVPAPRHRDPPFHDQIPWWDVGYVSVPFRRADHGLVNWDNYGTYL